MPFDPPMRRSRALQALFLAMMLVVMCALVLLFLAYRHEKARTLHALQSAYIERVDALDRCLFLARENVSLMEDWARSYWQDAGRRDEPPGLVNLLQYDRGGDFFEISRAAIETLGDPTGNVFGPGRPLGRSPQFIRELNLVAGLMPLLRVAVSDSGVISAGYFFSVRHVSVIYPHQPLKVLCGSGATGPRLKAKVDVFFRSHRELYGHAARNGYWTGVYRGCSGNGPVVTFAMPVYAGKRLLGLLGADVKLALLARFVAGFRGPDSRLILIGRNGRLLMDSADGAPLPRPVNTPFEERLPPALRKLAPQIINGSAPLTLAAGGYHVVSRRLRSAPCSLVHIISDSSLRSYLSMTWGTFTILVPMLLALLLLGYFAMRRSQAEQALLETQKQWQEFVEHSAMGIYRVHDNGSFIFANPKMARLFGYPSPGEFMSAVTEVASLYIEPDERLANLETLKKDGFIDGAEVQLRHRDGRTLWGQLYVRQIKKGGSRCYEGCMIDVTARKSAEFALRESEERNRGLIELFPDAVLVHIKLEIVYINHAGARMLGARKPAELIGRSVMDIVHPDYQRRIEERLARVESSRLPLTPEEQRYVRLDGQVIDVEATGVQVAYGGRPAVISVLRDITERKRQEAARYKLELQLQQSQKMEAIGTLAGGIAHDFNNLLMGIQGNISLSLLEIDAGHAAYENLKNIETYIRRATRLTQQILGFARGGKYQVESLDLNRLIQQSARMFGRTRKEIRIALHLDGTLQAVKADRSQIDQVLLNLFVNAWQAMPAGGRLDISTCNVSLDADFVQPYGLAPGKYVKVSVTDSGVGMDEETRRRIFEPFFTSKSMGRGTGLGLASVYGIVSNHKGAITVSSQPGHGTTFDIYLPSAGKITARPAGGKAPARQMEGHETILLVDDEQMIIDVGKKLLESMGYHVLVGKGGRAALEIYKKSGPRIDLVILDMIMPDMSGSQTYDRLKRLDPDVKVLLSSGYSLNDKSVDILHRGGNGFIQKPYDRLEVAAKIREILDRG